MRGQALGASLPDHYLIPALVTEVVEGASGANIRVRRYDPAKPTKGWRTAWRKLTKLCWIAWPQRTRPAAQLGTGHAEIGTPQSVLEAQAGHLSKRMSDHYKHISEKAARKASDELARVRTEQRAEARAKLREQASANTTDGLVDSVVIPGVQVAVNATQSAAVH